MVTGASRGVGRQVALHLGERGAAVAAIARASAALTDLQEQAARAGGVLRAVAADVTAPAEVDSAFAAVETDLGPVTLAVACAGTDGPLGPLHLADPEAWWRAVEVDLRGTMLTARSAVGRMVARRAGRFVTVYGNLGDRLGLYVSAFAAAKAGVARLTEMLAGEVEDSGVRVFGLHPGFVRTPLTERLAWGAEGKAWLPRFGIGVEDRWETAGRRPSSSRRSRSARPTPCRAAFCMSGTTWPSWPSAVGPIRTCADCDCAGTHRPAADGRLRSGPHRESAHAAGRAAWC